MGRKRFTAEQIINMLREAEVLKIRISFFRLHRLCVDSLTSDNCHFLSVAISGLMSYRAISKKD